MVLFTTEDSFNKEAQIKLKLFKSLSDLYASNYSFHCIIFTNNPDVADLFDDSKCSVVKDVRRNPYGIPFINSMYWTAQIMADARFYGYANSDILIEPTLFDILSLVEQLVSRGDIPPYLELAGRVNETSIAKLPPSFASMKEVKECFGRIDGMKPILRNKYSAVSIEDGVDV